VIARQRKEVSRLKVRIGIIGAGWWSTYAHIPTMLRRADVELVGLCDPDESRLARAAQHYGISKTYTSAEQLLNERPDGVIIATPHHTHYQLAKMALLAGADVLVEKPMTIHAREARELVQLAKERGRNLHVGYPWPYTAHAQAVRAAVLRGDLGRILAVESFFASNVYPLYRGRPDQFVSYPVHGPKESTYSDPAVAGGGQGQTQVTHSASLLFFLSGLRPRRVSAFMTHGGLQVDVADMISFTTDGEAVGQVGSTGLVPLGHRESGEYRIYGTSGYALLDTHLGTLQFYGPDGRVTAEPTLAEEERYPYWATSERLVDTLLGTKPVHVDGELGALTVAFLEAAYASAGAGGAPVDVAEMSS
jgi:predicted dehydrogenase